MSLKFLSAPQKRLLQGITSTSSTFYLNNILSWDGENDISASDLGTIHYVCFRNDTGTVVEFMEIDPSTLIAGGPITINKRGLAYNGDLTTESADRKYDWPVNTIVMLGTDVSQIFQWLKEYIDNIAIAGAPDATTSTKGLVKMSTAPADPDSPIAVGDNDTRIPTQGENDALAGGSTFGTPSSTNKFITENYYSASAPGKLSSTVTVGENINGSTTPIPVFVSPAYDVNTINKTGTGNSFDNTGEYKAVSLKIVSVTTNYVNKVTARIKKTGTIGNVTVSLYTDSGGNPNALIGTIGVISASSISTSYSAVSVINLGTYYQLAATTHVVFSFSAPYDGSNYISFDFDPTGSDAILRQSNDDSWTAHDATCTPNVQVSQYYETGKVYKSAAATTMAGRNKFDGFISSNIVKDATGLMSHDGLQGSFSSLTTGVTYYIQDTIGTLGTSAGSASLPVGKSLSTTTILM